MGLLKITASDLMPGSEAWWHKQSAINHPERVAAAPAVQVPAATEPLTQDDVTMEKYGPNGDVINIDKKPVIAKRSMPQRDVPAGMDMPVRNADGSAQVWKSAYNVPDADRQRAGATAGRIGTKASDALKTKAKAGGTGGNTVATQGTVRSVDSYDRMLEFLKAQQALDADADKRARRREMMAAIGDGISAISSLYQTTKGAPVTYTPGKDMSEVMRQRYDRYIAQRKADSDKYLNYLKMQAARDNALMETQYKTRRLVADEDRNERENRKLDWLIEHGKNQDNAKQYSNETNRQHLERTDEIKKGEQERKEKDSENKRENTNKRTEAYVAAQDRKGSGSSKSKSKKSKSTSSNTPPSRRSGNTNNNNVRPSKR